MLTIISRLELPPNVKLNIFRIWGRESGFTPVHHSPMHVDLGVAERDSWAGNWRQKPKSCPHRSPVNDSIIGWRRHSICSLCAFLDEASWHVTQGTRSEAPGIHSSCGRQRFSRKDVWTFLFVSWCPGSLNHKERDRIFRRRHLVIVLKGYFFIQILFDIYMSFFENMAFHSAVPNTCNVVSPFDSVRRWCLGAFRDSDQVHPFLEFNNFKVIDPIHWEL